MAEFKLGRIRFVWKGNWSAATTYYVDDVVRYGGKTFICVEGHTSDSDFYTDLNISPTKWNTMSDGFAWTGDWTTSQFYKIGDIAKYGGQVYIAVTNHTSNASAGTGVAGAETTTGLEADQAKWDIFTEGFDWKGNWAATTRYKVNDIIKHGGTTYVCKTGHTSAPTLEADRTAGYWDYFNQGIEFVGTWTSGGTRYKVNDVVKYGSNLWLCTTAHNSTTTFLADSANWTVWVEGFEFESDWNSATTYQPGDIVRYGGNQYVSKTNHVNSIPPTSPTDWDLFLEGFKYQSDWSNSTNYKIGDVVRLNGYTYIATKDSPSISVTAVSANAGNNRITFNNTTGIVAGMSITFSGTSFGDINTGATYFVKTVVSATELTITDIFGGTVITPTTSTGSMPAIVSAIPPNSAYWNRLNSGISWQGEWQDDRQYVEGDAVRYGANAYICIKSHRSEGDDGSTVRAQGGGADNSRPDQDNTGTYWNLLSIGSELTVLTTTGDLVYYGGAGPVRLPVGTEGQVLRVSSTETPEWVSLGQIENVYYVGPEGFDGPAPVHGTTLDKPWASIRYACEQVEKGPKNPNAKFLLEMNRAFIQRETTEWIDYQIANAVGGSIWDGFTYEDFKCERDTGLIVDAIVHDLGKGGNVKSRAAALTYVNALADGPFSNEDDGNGTGPYTTLGIEGDNNIAAFNYMLSVVQAVLNQEAPAVNYQVLNGDNSTAVVSQYFDADKSAEEGAYTKIQSLVGIITTALADGNADNVPARLNPSGVIYVKTGTYEEMLPIVVPAEYCLLGDEVRSSIAKPVGGSVDITDAKYSIGAVEHIRDTVIDVIVGNTVTPTSGNNEIQDIAVPFADTVEVEDLELLGTGLAHDIDYRLNTMSLVSSTDPTGYNTSYLNGYGNARKLIKENKKWFQEEVIAFLETSYPDAHYGKTKTRRDVGYIVDALVYDLTYGGNALSIKAGLAYYDGDDATLPQIPSEIEALTIASLQFLRTRMSSVILGNVVTPLQTNIARFTDTAGSAAASNLVIANVGAIMTIIQSGPSAVGTSITLVDPTPANGVNTTTALINAYNTLDAAADDIAISVVDYINNTYGSFTYNSSLCRRDSEILVDAGYYDAAFGSNFWAVQNGISYFRRQASVVTAQQLEQEIGAVRFIKSQAATSLASSATAVTRSSATYDEIVDILENGIGAANALVFTDTGITANTNARTALQSGKATLVSNALTYLQTNYAGLWASLSPAEQALGTRDLTYIVDALSYDIQYGGNLASRNAARAFYSAVTGESMLTTSAQRTAYADTIDQLAAAAGTLVGGGEGTTVQGLAEDISDIVLANDLNQLNTSLPVSNPSLSWVDPSIAAAVGQLSTDKTAIVKATLQYISDTFNTFTYDHAKAERDTKIVLKAVGYDFMFNANYQTVKAGHAYRRETAIELFDSNTLIKQSTLGALEYARQQAIANVGGDATAITRINSLMAELIAIVKVASNDGSECLTTLRNAHYAVLQLERNRDFIVAESTAWIADTYSDTVTATTNSDSSVTISDTSWLQRNTAIRFNSTIGGLAAGTTYYVQNILSSTKFTVATTRYATGALSVTDDTGSVIVSMYYNSALCERDVNRFIDGFKHDIRYPGNYETRYAARYYSNAVTGCAEEDMFYLRNGTGVRNMTLDGLNGQLTPNNPYGTRRVTAGAYCSLDPGFGPADFRAWIISRSPYVQNVATFGNAAVGQKIDGSLHNGGNRSIVSNDFTQLISDGIGAWITNNGRAELVSVFTYYSHIGYLAENGGRIRGTNGNNSYGDFGSVAEGFDSTETPNTAIVDNRSGFDAVVGTIVTTGDQICHFEFQNAGSEYTEATWTILGPGSGAVIEQDEFRDDAVFQVRLLDLGNDSSGQFGGEGYLTNANTAQGGNLTSITLAAVDQTISTGYVGMKVFLTGGAGAGQYAIIQSYNAGTKLASIVKESDGTAGWDNIINGGPIVSPDASTTYVVEPAISFSAPGFSTTKTSLPATTQWNDVVYGETTGTYTGLLGDTYSGVGSGAEFTVVRNGTKYSTINITNAGTGYLRLETITIDGTNLGGESVTNDLVITITSINAITGAIVEFETDGFGLGGQYVAVGDSNNSATSHDGLIWVGAATSTSYGKLSYGLFDDGSSLQKTPRFVAIENGTGFGAAWSATGTSWTASSLPVSATWVDVDFGEGRFVAIADDNVTTAISQDGEDWDITGTLPSTGFKGIAYGKGLWVAVKPGQTSAAAWSDDGGVTWTDVNMPANQTWGSVAYGLNMFVAIASDSNIGAYSTDGATWTAMTIGSPDSTSPAGLQQVEYGQGVFMATVANDDLSGYHYVAKSDNGLTWTYEDTLDSGDSTDTSGFDALAFGNPQREGHWVVIEKTRYDGLAPRSTDYAVNIRTGARAKGRAFISQEKIFEIRLHEPGSGYDTAPTMTITDPNNIFEIPFSVRIGKGAIANPSFKNRGAGYITANAELFSGDGYADFYQSGSFVFVKRLSQRPVPGSNIVFGHLPNRVFKLVNVLTFLGQNDGSYTAFFQVSPDIAISEAPENGISVTTRIRYSQVRLTGHDFLDIGTGSFDETNYPNVPNQEPIPANETQEANGGRVFFTATDQDGNFRVGDLFAVEQSTGIATLNADAFNIAGLQELTLGEVTLGGGSAAINEFSTDPFFTADSDSVVPTQRAIKAYIASQIGGGGAALNVNSVTAGAIYIGSNQITTTSGGVIAMRGKFRFDGTVSGYPVAWNYFLT